MPFYCHDFRPSKCTKFLEVVRSQKRAERANDRPRSGFEQANFKPKDHDHLRLSSSNTHKNSPKVKFVLLDKAI